MKSQENDAVFLLHGCLQIDEASRRGWAARSAPQLAQRLRQLAPDSFSDVNRLSSYLQRRRRPLCWCLLLLGGRVDVQLHAVAELYSQCSDPSEAAFLQQSAAELTLLQQQQQQQQEQQQQEQQQGQPNGVAVTPGLLPDEDGGGTGGGDGEDSVGRGGGGGGTGRGRPPEVVSYCTERLAALLARVRHDPECEELFSHAASRRSGAALTCLIRMLAPAAAAGGGAGGGKGTKLAAHAARALSYLSAFSELRRPLLAAGAVPQLLGCLGPHPHPPPRQVGPTQQQQQQRLSADAAQCLANLSGLEAAGREVLRAPHEPGGAQALVALLSGGFGAAAVEPAVHALAALSAHPTLRPGLVAAGATEALISLVERSGGPLLAAWAADPPSPAAGGGGGGGSPGGSSASGGGGAAAPQKTMELALLALVRCIRSYGSGTAAAPGVGGGGGGGGGGGEVPAAALQLLVDVAAMPTRSAPSSASPPRGAASPPPPSAKPLWQQQQQQQQHQSAGSSPSRGAAVGGGGGGGEAQQPQPPAAALAVVEATEALADMAREAPGALRVLSYAGHLVLLQRLLAIMPASPLPSSSFSSPTPTSTSTSSPTSSPPSLDPLSRRQLDACLRGLARLALAAPSHPDLRLARTHEALLAVLLAVGLADRTGWWALQGLCALATDASCAADLVRAGVLPPVVAALRGLAAAQPKRRSSLASLGSAVGGGGAAGAAAAAYGGGGGGVGSSAAAAAAAAASAAASERDVEVAHLLGLLLQNLAGHKALARVAVEEGAVPAICEWLAVCVCNDDVEGAVLCCASLCLLGDGEQGALVDMVHADGLDTLVALLHPRWATAALVPSTVASAIAVACRWPASAQAVRMASGIPALTDTLRGPHGLACCRPVVSALVDLITNDPPALREIR
ncbi:hypothetical protein PLESTM_000903700 [Pleodorina starrii]|nr:hypothetical protein PLESTM_000903700 [Pleodorina starrii]